MMNTLLLLFLTAYNLHHCESFVIYNQFIDENISKQQWAITHRQHIVFAVVTSRYIQD